VEELAETFVELADVLSDEFDLVAFLDLLSDRCVRLLDMAAAGVLLVDHGGRPNITGGSDERATLLTHLDDGPLHDCYRTGAPAATDDLSITDDRWPQFAPAAKEAGFTAVQVVPLRLRAEVMGALALFRTAPGAPDKTTMRVAQALADVTAIGLAQKRALRQQADLAAQLQHALTSRVAIEQAKGVVAERHGVSVNAAFTMLRTHARSSNTRIADLALSIVDGEFDTDRLR
jgi:GAF domain-containing protein